MLDIGSIVYDKFSSVSGLFVPWVPNDVDSFQWGLAVTNSRAEPSPLTIGLLTFPNITQLDLTGPYEVFSRLSGARVELVWKSVEPVQSDTGFTLVPTIAFAECPQLDVIVVPGGPGQQGLMEDEDVLSFIRSQSAGAQWIMSVCTGSLVLGAAGLLTGKPAACHWLSLPILEAFGAIPSPDRVVRSGNILSTAGVSAGIDGALALIAEMRGQQAAEQIQLAIEYDPRPLFSAGSPATAPAELVDNIRAFAADFQKIRMETARRAAARLSGDPESR